MSASQGRVKVTLVRSPAGHLHDIANSVRGLGLRKVRSSAVLTDTPQVRGMIRRARHLLKVEEAQ